LRTRGKSAKVAATAHQSADGPILLAGTRLLRAYVCISFAAFLLLASRDLGWRRTPGWLGWGWAAAKGPGLALGGIGSDYGNVLFNLGITGWIGKRTLLGAGNLVHVAVFLLGYAVNTTSVTRAWTGERPARDRATTITTTIN
jgi:hypothetical protein